MTQDPQTVSMQLRRWLENELYPPSACHERPWDAGWEESFAEKMGLCRLLLDQDVCQ